MRYRYSSMLALVALFSVSAPALAYIDPGSGSAIMSAIIGFIVAVSMAVKSYWYKIKSLFTGNDTSSAPEDSDAADANPAQEN